jgi:hypothetical protein
VEGLLILGLTPRGYTMSPPFEGFGNMDVLLILGLTPPGYTKSPQSGALEI